MDFVKTLRTMTYRRKCIEYAIRSSKWKPINVSKAVSKLIVLYKDQANDSNKVGFLSFQKLELLSTNLLKQNLKKLTQITITTNNKIKLIKPFHCKSCQFFHGHNWRWRFIF